MPREDWLGDRFVPGQTFVNEDGEDEPLTWRAWAADLDMQRMGLERENEELAGQLRFVVGLISENTPELWVQLITWKARTEEMLALRGQHE